MWLYTWAGPSPVIPCNEPSTQTLPAQCLGTSKHPANNWAPKAAPILDLLLQTPSAFPQKCMCPPEAHMF